MRLSQAVSWRNFWARSSCDPLAFPPPCVASGFFPFPCSKSALEHLELKLSAGAYWESPSWPQGISAGSEKRDSTESAPCKSKEGISLSTGGLGLKDQCPLCKPTPVLYMQVGCTCQYGPWHMPVLSGSLFWWATETQLLYARTVALHNLCVTWMFAAGTNCRTHVRLLVHWSVCHPNAEHTISWVPFTFFPSSCVRQQWPFTRKADKA